MFVMKPHLRSDQNVRSARGASMIEVLIAILVISIGLLGIAALQTTALKTASDSYNLTQATIQAVDLGERFWAAACILYRAPPEDAVKAVEGIVAQWKQPQEPPGPSLLLMKPFSTQVPEAWNSDTSLSRISTSWGPGNPHSKVSPFRSNSHHGRIGITNPPPTPATPFAPARYECPYSSPATRPHPH